MYLAIGFSLTFGVIWHCLTIQDNAQKVAEALSKEIKSCCRETTPLWPDTILFVENGSIITNTKGQIVNQETPDILFRWNKGIDYVENSN